MKSRNMVLSAAFALLLTTAAHAQITLTDIGGAPTPGTYDIAQLSTNGTDTTPPGLNYYWDDGRGNPDTGYPGQTFTTLGNSSGYTLTSLAIKTDGGGGDTPTTNQSFTLYIYQISGTGLTNSTLLNTFTATSALNTEGDWMQWSGLGVNLAPNSTYGFAFGITPSDAEDWERMSTGTNLPYAGGQACLIPDAGGLITYSTTPNDYDATFDIGLILPSAPIPAPPVESPSSANLAVLPGTNVTLTATSAGLTPILWQWQTDGGSGNTPTNIAGATSTNLVVNTTGWSNGTYVFDFVASNSLGVSTSPTANIVITNVFMADIGSNMPTPGPVDISQLLYSDQDDDGFNYYTDNGAGHSAWSGQTFTTGTNTSGYVMTSLTWKSDGNGNSFPTIQLYDFYVFALSGAGATNATQIASYQAYGGGTEFDWFKWVGLFVPLTPNTQYAYAFGRDTSSTGWEHIADQGGNPYPGGQLCTIFPATGGPVTYGTTGDSDATFDIGLIVSQKPFANEPTYTPNITPIYAGSVVTLSEAAVGTPPLAYQWLADNGTGGGTWTPVSGATQTNLVLNTTALNQPSYEYEVIVSNASGLATSAPVTLTISPASEPVINTDIAPAPANEGYVGETVSYSATFVGTLPITYQWMVNTGAGPTPISGSSNPSALTPTLSLTNLQMANAGTYSLSASNAVGGPVSSSSSTLSVLVDPAAPAAGTYGALELADGPVVYWPLNETEDPSTGVLPAYDASGHNFDGLYGAYSETGFNAISGPTPSLGFPGFAANNTALQSQNGAPDTYVTVPPLNLNTNAVTITMWIDPTVAQPVFNSLFKWQNAADTDAAGFGFGGTLNSANMAALGYAWNTNSATTYNWNSGLFPVENQWSFVALVVEPSQATIYLYYIDPNTSLPDLYSATQVLPEDPESFSAGTTLIGSDPYSLESRTFGGDIDEVAVFNQALTSDQILAMFTKGAGLGAVAPVITGQPESVGTFPKTVSFSATGVNGTSPLSYQWLYITATATNKLTDGGNISGSATPTLTISNATSADGGSYQLVVTNSAGTTRSSAASLNVVTPVAGSYEATIQQYGALAFWPLNETNADPANSGVVAEEYVNGLNGIYQDNAQDGYNGILGPESPAFPGFPADNTALGTTEGAVNSYVTASAGTLIATNLTYAMWINPSGPVENWAGLLMDRGAAGEGLGFGGSVNSSGMSELGYTWNQNSTWSWNSELYPPANQWSFVAMVIEPSQGTLYLINTNGIQSTNYVIPQDSEEFGVAWHIGNDAADGGNGSRTFPGSISSVSVFLSALSANQIVTLADLGLGITPPPPAVSVAIAPSQTVPGSLTLSWPQGTLLEATNLAGPWTTNTSAISPYTATPTNSKMFFKVIVN